MEERNVPRVTYYDHPTRKYTKLQVAGSTVFNDNREPSVLQITSNIIGLQCIKEEESEQEIHTNRDQ
jgi:hypothetical protein